MIQKWIIFLLMITATVSSFASTPEQKRACFRLLVTITEDQRASVELLTLGKTLISAQDLSRLQSSDAHLLGRLENLIEARRELENLAQANANISDEFSIRSQLEVMEELSNDFVTKLARILDSFGIEYNYIEKAGGDAIRLLPNGNQKLNRLISRAVSDTHVHVYIDPMRNLVNQNEASFSEGNLYLSLDSILKLNDRNQVINFLRPTGAEWHEFMHARFYQQRMAGADDEFNTIIHPIQNYLNSAYNSRYAIEEIPIHRNQLQFYRRSLLAVLNSNDYSAQTLAPVHELGNILLNTIVPLSLNTKNYADRILTKLNSPFNIIRLNAEEFTLFSDDLVGNIDVNADTLALTITTDEETSTLLFQNQFLIRRFRNLNSNSERAHFIKPLIEERMQQIRESIIPYLEQGTELSHAYAGFLEVQELGDTARIRESLQALYQLL